MNILATQYTLKNKSFEIYISGCRGNNGVHCKECHNPLSWDFDNGDPLDDDYIHHIKDKIREFDALVENIWILGGEPLDNDIPTLKWLIAELKPLNKAIWLFTRYPFETVRDMLDVNALDYIKCGEYIQELKTDNNIQYGVQLATSNQCIYKRGVDY